MRLAQRVIDGVQQLGQKYCKLYLTCLFIAYIKVSLYLLSQNKREIWARGDAYKGKRENGLINMNK